MTSVINILEDELNKLQADIVARHEAAGQVVSGRTRDSFNVETKGEYSGELSGAGYSGVLERGRKPGKLPYDFKNIILRWAAAKGITFSSPRQANTWAYFVTKKIREEGTTLYRSGNTEDIFTSAVQEFQERLADRVGVFFQEELANQIFIK